MAGQYQQLSSHERNILDNAMEAIGLQTIKDMQEASASIADIYMKNQQRYGPGIGDFILGQMDSEESNVKTYVRQFS